MSELEIESKTGQTRMKIHDNGDITYFDEHGEEISPKDFYINKLKQHKETSQDEDNV